MKKAKRQPKVTSIIKEDRQACGLLIGKATSLKEAFSYPITTLPLSLASPEGTLRQADIDKASFRNNLSKDSDALTDTFPNNARWIIDEMSVFRSVKTQNYVQRLVLTCDQNSYSTLTV